MPNRRADPEVVTTRARALAKAKCTQHWLVATGTDLAALRDGFVTEGLHAQAVAWLEQDRLESDEMYLARLADEKSG